MGIAPMGISSWVGANNYRGYLEHGLKILEKVLDKRLRNIIHIVNMQFGFTPDKGTTDAMFVIHVQEKRLGEIRSSWHSLTSKRHMSAQRSSVFES